MVVSDVSEFHLDQISAPRPKRIPKRLDQGTSEAHVFQEAKPYYRRGYYTMLDVAHSELQSRFDQDSFSVVRKAENSLVVGVPDECLKAYPEIDFNSLTVQLQMFRSSYSYETLQEAAELSRKAPSEVRQLFPEVVTRIRLLLVLPSSSCEAERSFSALRRLKTFLRSTMTQQRLNNVAVCHVHSTVLREINSVNVINDFVSLNDSRKHLFGFGHAQRADDWRRPVSQGSLALAGPVAP